MEAANFQKKGRILRGDKPKPSIQNIPKVGKENPCTPNPNPGWEHWMGAFPRSPSLQNSHRYPLD